MGKKTKDNIFPVSEGLSENSSRRRRLSELIKYPDVKRSKNWNARGNKRRGCVKNRIKDSFQECFLETLNFSSGTN